MNNIDFIKPEENEICICVLGGGNGYGESIVIHLGKDNWIIVDSAKNPTTKEILPIKFLQELGVSIENAVKLVLATHWHGDHIRGLYEVVKLCDSAIFSCSQALSNSEFSYLIGLDNQNELNSSSTREFAKIFDYFSSGQKSIKRAIQDRILLDIDLGNNLRSIVASLSPSDQSILDFEKSIKQEIKNYKSPNVKISSKSPNHSSVVLKIQIGSDEILLGADLENTPNEKTGWTAVLNSTLVPQSAQIFKIPHHGSSNAYNPIVWNKAVIGNNPIACVTPYNRGKSPLPTNKDIDSIYFHTQSAFVTSNPHTNRVKKRTPSEKKIIKSLGYKIEQISFNYGGIDLRKTINSQTDWNISLIGKAVNLHEIKN